MRSHARAHQSKRKFKATSSCLFVSYIFIFYYLKTKSFVCFHFSFYSFVCLYRQSFHSFALPLRCWKINRKTHNNLILSIFMSFEKNKNFFFFVFHSFDDEVFCEMKQNKWVKWVLNSWRSVCVYIFFLRVSSSSWGRNRETVKNRNLGRNCAKIKKTEEQNIFHFLRI